MGRVVKGMLKGVSGKVGDIIVNQQKDGSATVQSVPKPKEKSFSQKELDGQQPTRVWNTFLKPIKEYFEVGYVHLAKKQKQNQNNAIVSHICSSALIRKGKDSRIVYSKVLMTRGNMLPPENIIVEAVETGILVSWDKEITEDGQHYSDRIMILAYFTELMQACDTTAGAERIEGQHLLPVRNVEHGTIAHIWVSFTKKNGKDMSDSVYVGEITW